MSRRRSRRRLRGRTRRRRRRKRRRRRRNTRRGRTTTREGEEINSTVAIGKAFNVFLYFRLASKGLEDISRKSTGRLQQKQEPTGHKYLTYSEKWLTVNEITFPSNRGGVSSLSVISIHSCFSGLDSLQRTRTRATDMSMSFLPGSLSDKGR